MCVCMCGYDDDYSGLKRISEEDGFCRGFLASIRVPKGLFICDDCFSSLFFYENTRYRYKMIPCFAYRGMPDSWRP